MSFTKAAAHHLLINSFKKLNDDCDASAALGVYDSVIKLTHLVINVLEQKGCLPDKISILDDIPGGIELDWDNNWHYVWLWIEANGASMFTVIDSRHSGVKHEKQIGTISDICEKICELLAEE